MIMDSPVCMFESRIFPPSLIKVGSEGIFYLTAPSSLGFRFRDQEALFRSSLYWFPGILPIVRNDKLALLPLHSPSSHLPCQIRGQGRKESSLYFPVVIPPFHWQARCSKQHRFNACLTGHGKGHTAAITACSVSWPVYSALGKIFSNSSAVWEIVVKQTPFNMDAYSAYHVGKAATLAQPQRMVHSQTAQLWRHVLSPVVGVCNHLESKEAHHAMPQG